MNIGQYISSLDAPASSGLPKATPDQFGAGVAEAMGAFAGATQAFQDKALDIQRTQDVARLSVETHKQIGELNNQLETAPDWQTHVSRFEEGYDKIQKDILSGITDPVVKKTMIGQLGTLGSNGIMNAQARSRAMFVDQSQAGRASMRQAITEAAVVAADPAPLISIWVGLTRADVAVGNLSAEEGAKEEVGLIEDVQVGVAKRDIMADPAAYWRKKAAGEYSRVGIGKMDLLDAQAVRQSEHNEKAVERQIKKAWDIKGAEVSVGTENGTVDDATLDELFFGPPGAENFTPQISPERYREEKLKLAAQRKEGGPSNPGQANRYKIELSLNPNAYSDQAIATHKGLNPKDKLDILEYKRQRINDLHNLPPGASTQLTIIREAIPRGFMNEMTDKHRAMLVEAEQEFIKRTKKNPEKVDIIGAEIANRLKAAKKSGMSVSVSEEDRKKLMEYMGESGK